MYRAVLAILLIDIFLIATRQKIPFCLPDPFPRKTGQKIIKNVNGIHRTFLQLLSSLMVLHPYVLLTSGITLGNLNIP